MTLGAFLGDRGLLLRADLLGAWAHWVTPEFEPRRFDTRFLVAVLPTTSTEHTHGTEADASFWIDAGTALQAADRGELAMMTPTRSNLERFQQAGRRGVAEAVLASTQQRVPTHAPRLIEVDGQPLANVRRGVRVVMTGLDQELRELAISMRKQAWRRLSPGDAELDRTQRFSPETWGDVQKLGLVGLSFAEADGGAGASPLALVVALEQVAYASAVAALYPGTTIQVTRALLDHASPALRDRWVPRLIAGDDVAAWAFTEPQTGSDPKQLTTRARRDGDGWVLDGEKAFISYAAVAAVALVFAINDSGAVCAFLVETGQPGWAPGSPLAVLAFGSAEARPVHLDGVRVGADALVGAEGDGFSVMLAGEALGKLRVAAINVGVAQRALDEATRYALQRTHRGVAIGEKFPTTRALLADMSASVLAARAALYATAARLETGSRPGRPDRRIADRDLAGGS